MKIALNFFIAGVLVLGSCVNQEQEKVITTQQAGNDWPAYGGNKAGSRYSPLNQINLQNVHQLQIAWTYDTGENNDPNERGTNIQTQPIEVNGIVYGVSPKLKLFATQAATGEQVWKFDPYKGEEGKYHPSRGIVYWEDDDEKRIFFAAGSTLYSVNALTGELDKNFGTNGGVSLHTGLEDPDTLGRDISQLRVDLTTPGVIYKDLYIIGSRVSEYGDAAPGHIRAFNTRTGKLEWIFRTIPQPGEVGYDTWPKDAYKRVGGANVWGGLVADEVRGIVYAGTGSAAYDFYGGNREGENLFANSLIALNAETGERMWHFQTKHHDIWDLDIPSPPNLVTVNHNGKEVDAVAVTTKDGLIFVFDRVTGDPLFPIEEVPTPTTGALPGEHPWPTQPMPTKPAPLNRQEFTEEDITDISPEAHAHVKELFKKTSGGQKFLPPSRDGIFYFGMFGGAEWGGNAVDPEGILYVNANESPAFLKMSSIAERLENATRGKILYTNTCAPCHGADGQGSDAYPSLVDVGKRLPIENIVSVVKSGRGRMPSFQHLPDEDREAIIRYLLNPNQSGSAADFHSAAPTASENPESDFPYMPPYINNGYTKVLDPNGYPGIKPPWGTLNAIDLNTGEYLWKVPLGEFPELAEKGITNTGSESYGGPIVTAGGLIFIAGTRDEKMRAFNKETGEVVWEYKLPTGAYATPITYLADNGKQYVVIAAGGSRYGSKPGGSYIAFALPE